MVYGLGERLTENRIARKLSQKQVAYAVGVTPAMISNYERGERTPKLETLMKIAELYHCSVDYLLYGRSMERVDVSLLTDEECVALQTFINKVKGV